MELINKIFGWILLFAGVAVIGYSLSSSHDIFTAKTEVPEIFKIAQKEAAPPQIKKGTTPDLQAQMEEMTGKMLGEQLEKLLPSDFLPKLFNLVAWSIFAGILIFGGTQISVLGIKLIK